MDNDKKMIAYLEHLDTNLYTNYTDQDNASFWIYREETVDGYEVFVAKYKEDKHINIMDDVYYYQHDLSNIIIEKTKYIPRTNSKKSTKRRINLQNKRPLFIAISVLAIVSIILIIGVFTLR